MKYLLTLLIILFCSQTYASPIRMVALKHSNEPMADEEVNLAIKAIKEAKSQGLDIEIVSNRFANRNGVILAAIQNFNYDIPKFKEYVSEQMKVKAISGDTLILFTVGHGDGSGLAGLGSRAIVMKAIAEAAEENQQKTIWWQLSCHACAGLPSINSLTPNQQNYLSVIAASEANEIAGYYIQGAIMEKLFVAIARDTSAIDPDQNGVITAKEVSLFLDHIQAGKGRLVFAASSDEPLFELISIINTFPIVNSDDSLRPAIKNYLPSP